jgi:branched-subunit amino acid aminotransferase/4-amino-4-deoxychorismate lyase
MTPTFSPLLWHNGRIKPHEGLALPLCIELTTNESELIEELICYSACVIGWDKIYSRLRSLAMIYNIRSPLFSDSNGDKLASEIKRLHVRNNNYKWTRCYLWCRIDFISGQSEIYLFLATAEPFTSINQQALMACMVSRLPKPIGNAIFLPSVYNAYLRMALRECQQNQCEIGLLIQSGTQIIDTTHGNLFVIKDAIVLIVMNETGTQPSDFLHIAIDQLHTSGIETQFIDFALPEMMHEAHEAFVVGNKGIFAIKGFETKRYYDKTRQILAKGILQLVMATDKSK